MVADVTETETHEEELDLAPLDEALDGYAEGEGTLIAALQTAQELYGYLPECTLRLISERLDASLSQVYEVATFYAQFYLERRGRHIVRVCDGTACHVRGAPKIIRALERELGIEAGETTPDYRVTLEMVYCLGSCGLSPVAVIDGDVIGRLVPEKAVELVNELE